MKQTRPEFEIGSPITVIHLTSNVRLLRFPLVKKYPVIFIFKVANKLSIYGFQIVISSKNINCNNARKFLVRYLQNNTIYGNIKSLDEF